MQILSHTHFNFIKWRWHAIALSAIVIIVGIGQIIAQGGPRLGVEFAGGTSMILRFQQPVAEDAVRNAIATLPGGNSVQRVGADDRNDILVKLPQQAQGAEGKPLDDPAQQVENLVRQANLGTFTREETEIVGPVVGQDLQRKGIYATLTALLGIMIYIGLRFRFTFAIGAIVATLHDVLICLVFLNWFGYELTLSIIAALLTMTGYSVNDTIVVFDRVRENTRTMRKDALEPLVNTSVNQTLSRTVITAGTTFLAVAGLYFYGGDALEGFAFTMLIGIISGTYSTVFIAAAIAIVLTKPMAPTQGGAARARAKGKS